jgi:hypothetical protein
MSRCWWSASGVVRSASGAASQPAIYPKHEVAGLGVDVGLVIQFAATMPRVLVLDASMDGIPSNARSLSCKIVVDGQAASLMALKTSRGEPWCAQPFAPCRWR